KRKQPDDDDREPQECGTGRAFEGASVDGRQRREPGALARDFDLLSTRHYSSPPSVSSVSLRRFATSTSTCSTRKCRWRSGWASGEATAMAKPVAESRRTLSTWATESPAGNKPPIPLVTRSSPG